MIFINHENELNWSGKYQGLYFYAMWMPFNQKIIRVLGNMENNTPNGSIFAIDTDHFTGLCRRFDVTSIPTIIIMIDGKECKRIERVAPSEEIAAIFDDICTT